MIKIKSTDRVTIAGLPGSGKTTLAKYLASLCSPNVLIYDPLSQYDGFPDECRYIPQSDSLAEFESVCHRLRAQGGITFVVEEAERYLGQGKPLGPHAFDLINRGRNWGVGVFAVTRRIQRLSKDFFDLCQHCFLFRCGLKSKEYLADMIGWENFREMRRMDRYHFMEYDVETELSSINTLQLGPAQRVVEAKGAETEEKKPAEAERKEGEGERDKVTEPSAPYTKPD